MTANDQLPPSITSPAGRPAVNAGVPPLEVQAIRRAAEIGIDPYRVALALAVPLDAVPGLLAEAEVVGALPVPEPDRSSGTSSPPGFDVQVDDTVEYIGQLVASGALDGDGGARLVATVRQLMTDVVMVVLDLRRLTFCDTAGVEAVLRADAVAREANGSLVIRSAPPEVHRAFELTGAAERLRIVGPPTTPPRP